MPGTIQPNGDVTITAGPLTFKARCDEIVIRSDRSVDFYESLRLLQGEDKMGEPMARTICRKQIADFANVSINGVTGAQVVAWIAAYGATINAADADGMLASLIPPTA